MKPIKKCDGLMAVMFPPNIGLNHGLPGKSKRTALCSGTHTPYGWWTHIELHYSWARVGFFPLLACELMWPLRILYFETDKSLYNMK